jgi:hypothetical protein
VGDCIVSVSVVSAATDMFTPLTVSKVSHEPAMGLVGAKVANINALVSNCGIDPATKRVLNT